MHTLRTAIALSLPLAVLLCGSAGAAAKGVNQLTIKVANGPYAGAYQSEASSTICIKVAARDLFSSAWKDFEAEGNKMAEAGVEVGHPDAPGPKHGTVRVSFGKDGKAAIYQIFNQPLTLTLTAHGARIVASGKTPDGIGISLEAVCEDVELL